MPCISMFYGLLIYMYHFDNKQHKLPHIHVEYQDDKAIFIIASGEMMEGKLPNKQRKLVEAWIELHRDELLADWQLAISGQDLFKIDPLK
jgi:hypothetical protein